MKKSSKLTAILLAAGVLLTGCASESSQENEMQYSIQTPELLVATDAYSVYNNGILYIDANQQARFLGFETMQSIPLCNKPNCPHNTPSCLAKICTRIDCFTKPVIYHDMLYYFTCTSEVVDAGDGKSTEYVVHAKCMQASLHTGEVKTFAEIENLNPTDNYSVVLIDDILYFLGSDSNARQDESGAWSSGSGGKMWLCSLNLNTGDFANYGLVNDSPYVDNSNLDNGSNHYSFDSRVYITGYYQGKIYMWYKYVKDQQLLLDSLREHDNDIFQVDGDDDIWTYENKCFDIKTGKIETSDLPHASLRLSSGDSDVYTYMDNGTAYYMTADGESHQVTDIDIPAKADSIFIPTAVGGKLWFGWPINSICYDIESQQPRDIIYPLFQEDDNAEVIAYHDGKYILHYNDENYQQQFEAVTESELFGSEAEVLS